MPLDGQGRRWSKAVCGFERLFRETRVSHLKAFCSIMKDNLTVKRERYGVAQCRSFVAL